jgi:glucose-1-phosphate thymidylyltransferase
VTDPERYGVVGFDTSGRVETIVEKPKNPPSNYAVTGLYFVDETAPTRTKKLTPSDRGELEITDLLNSYLMDDDLVVEKMGRGFAWLDTGTHNSLLDAGNFVKTLTERQGLQVGSPDEISFHQGWITKEQLSQTADKFGKSIYGRYLAGLLNE